MNLRFYKVRGISLLAENVLASQQGLYPMELRCLISVFLTGVIAGIYRAYTISVQKFYFIHVH